MLRSGIIFREATGIEIKFHITPSRDLYGLIISIMALHF